MSGKVLIYGASGFIGSSLAETLLAQGYQITGVSRKASPNMTASVKGISQWVTPENVQIAGQDIIINLAGSPIDQRWTKEKKKELHTSRIGVTNQIIAKIAALPPHQRPKILLSSSGVGYYGDTKDELITEKSPPGKNFLADLCVKWEEAAQKAEALGLRVITYRTGIVLGKGGGAYEKLITIFKLGIGARLSTGQQWMPWIHITDLQRGMLFSIQTETISGPVNGTAPHPERNIHLTQKLAKALNRWVFFPVPSLALKIVIGEFSTFLLQGQNALPTKLQEHGFTFKFAKLEDALVNLTTH